MANLTINKRNMPSASRIKQFSKQLNAEIGKEALLWYKEGFNVKGGRTNAGKWKPRKKPHKNPLLIKTGKLKKSLKISNVTQKGVALVASTRKVGALKEYAGFINYGTSKMVAREFLGKSDKLQNKILKIIKQEVYHFGKKFTKK